MRNFARAKRLFEMNYEEMLNTREGVATHKTELPLGMFYKKLIEKKYRNIIELKQDLTDNIVFCERLKQDCELSNRLNSNYQLRYVTKEDSGGIYAIEIESGNYQTFSQLMEQNPAVVAGKDFVEETMRKLVDVTKRLNEEGVYQICYAPQVVFARKNDNTPLLLTHGSFYQNVSDMDGFYEGLEDFIAPELREGGEADERSDVYGLAKFMECLFDQMEMPLHYKQVLKKATSENPDKRYYNVSSMMASLKHKRSFFKVALWTIIAILLAVAGVFVYFDMRPQPTDMDYIESGIQKNEVDPYDESFDLESELGLVPTDSLGNEMTPEKEREMAEYRAKAEQIFRKRYAKEAERILAKVYNKENLQKSQQKFMDISREMNEELVKIQVELGEEADLSNEKSQRIASEIIETISNRLKKEINMGYGVQRGGDEEEDEPIKPSDKNKNKE